MKASDLEVLSTESLCESTEHIDEMGTLEALKAINKEDQRVAEAVSAILPDIARLVDMASIRMKRGGRIFYIGAGTSGRLGVLDASECPPTYGVDSSLVQGVIAGGVEALTTSKEGAEDCLEEGANDLRKRGVSEVDVVIGLAASGRTPYVIGALSFARSIGALTGSISCVSDAGLSEYADCPIECVTGPECIMGSTRMKAGTAQKMILNMISTELMVKHGKVYRNLMVDVQPTNEKLVARACRIVTLASGCSPERAEALLEETGWDVKTAICMSVSGKSLQECRESIYAQEGNVARAIKNLQE